MLNKHSFEHKPLSSKIYKFKNPRVSFFCPLCQTKRYLKARPGLTSKNYIQILLLTIVATLLLYSIMGFYAIYTFFIFLSGMEVFTRLYYKNELPCEHCGFDALWYKKDVKVARKLVEEFWNKKNKKNKKNEKNKNNENIENTKIDPREPAAKTS